MDVGFTCLKSESIQILSWNLAHINIFVMWSFKKSKNDNQKCPQFYAGVIKKLKQIQITYFTVFPIALSTFNFAPKLTEIA